MTILLVGGNGLVGSKLVKALIEKGHKIIAYVERIPEHKEEGCSYVQGDLSEYGTINKIFHDNQIDRVIHNAAISHPKLFADNPYKIYHVNVLGTLNVLEAARNHDVRRFIYISSGAVYGNQIVDLVKEDMRLGGVNPYGASKVAAEEIVRNYGMDTMALRLGCVYGPGRFLECRRSRIHLRRLRGGDTMNHRQLEYIIELAKDKSFSEASKKLMVSQPSLSQYIQKMEAEVGTALFERSIPLKLTYAGEIYIQYARRVLNAEKQMEEILSDVAEEISGRMIIAAGPHNSISFLPTVVARFMQQWPKVEVVMKEVTEADLCQMAEDGEFDLAITTQNVDPKRFDYLPIMEEEVMLAVPKGYEFCQEHPQEDDSMEWVEFSECIELAFIMMKSSFPIQRCLENLFQQQNAQPRWKITCGSITAAHELVKAGVGAALIPSSTIRYGKAEEVCYYHIKPVPAIRPFGVFWMKGKYQTKIIQSFLQLLMNL